MKLTVFVPASFVPGETVRAGGLAGVAPGSAIVGARIVGSPDYDIAFEGNIYGASNLTRFAERCVTAAGRLGLGIGNGGYPTTARRRVSPFAVVPVGEWDGTSVLLNGNAGQLARWLAPTLDPGGLLDPRELSL